jgi:hypothetical protein
VPPVKWITAGVPPYAHSNNLRILYIPALAAAVLAGMGADALTRRPIAVRAAALWAGAVVAVAGLTIAVLVATGHAEGAGGERAEAVARFILFAAAGAACLLALGRLERTRALVLVVAVAVLDLAYLQDRNAILPADEAYPPKPPSVAFLERRTTPARVSAIRADIFQPAVLPGSTSALYDIEKIGGYELPQSKRWADFSYYVLGERGLTREIIFTTPPPRGPSLTAQRMMNVRYYMTAPGKPRPNPALAPAYRGRDATLWRDPGALPRAYVVPAVRKANYREALDALRAGRLDPRREALVPPDAPTPPRGGRFIPARSERMSSQHLRVRVPEGSGGWLVVANAYSRQWEATVDGRVAKLYPTDFAATGLPLGPGAHTVELRLRRTGLWLGLAITALSLLALLLLAGRRRPRSRSDASRPAAAAESE